MDIPEVADAPLQDQGIGNPVISLEGDRDILGVRKVGLYASLLGGRNNGLLLPADGVVKKCEGSRRLFAPIFLLQLGGPEGEAAPGCLSDQFE